MTDKLGDTGRQVIGEAWANRKPLTMAKDFDVVLAAQLGVRPSTIRRYRELTKLVMSKNEKDKIKMFATKYGRVPRSPETAAMKKDYMVSQVSEYVDPVLGKTVRVISPGYPDGYRPVRRYGGCG